MSKKRNEMQPQYFDVTLVIPSFCLIGFAKSNPNHFFILIAFISSIFFLFMRRYISSRVNYYLYSAFSLLYTASSIIISWRISYDRIGGLLGNVWLYLFSFLLLFSIIILIRYLSNLIIQKYIDDPKIPKTKILKKQIENNDVLKLSFLKEDLQKIKEIKKIINRTQSQIDTQAETITKRLNDLKFEEKYEEFAEIIKQKQQEINDLLITNTDLKGQHEVLARMKKWDEKDLKFLKKILFGRSRPIELIIGFILGLFVEFIARLFF